MNDSGPKQPFKSRRARMNPAVNGPAKLIVGLLVWFAASGVLNAYAQNTKADDALKSATETAKKIREATGSKPAPKAIPAGDPCEILSLADVQKAFAGAKAGERSRRLEEYGITECSWKGPKGAVVLAVQESNSNGTVKEDVMSMAQGFTDPLNPKARNNVRYESFSGVGTTAMGFVEQSDPKRGILSDGALLAMRDGMHTIWLMSNELPQRDRAAAVKALEELGKAASKRLKK